MALDTVVLALLIATPAAYALAQFRGGRRLFTFLLAWGDFLFALTPTTTEEVRPVTLGIYQYIGSFVCDWSSVMATAVLASLPAIPPLVIAQRYVAAGVTGGAVK